MDVLERIKTLFGIDLVEKDHVWIAALLSLKPVDEIKILGSELNEGLLS